MKIFISYHLADSDHVGKIKKKLHLRKIDFYSVPEDINFNGWHNEKIKDFLLFKMKECDLLLSIVGKETYKRPHVDYEIHEALKGCAGERLGIVAVLLENRKDSINCVCRDTFPPRLADNSEYVVLVQNASLFDNFDFLMREATDKRKDSSIKVNNTRKCMKLPSKYYYDTQNVKR